jgi:hypothetical protein
MGIDHVEVLRYGAFGLEVEVDGAVRVEGGEATFGFGPFEAFLAWLAR